MRPNGKKRSMAIRTSIVACAALGLAAASGPALPVSIDTSEDPLQPGAFSLDFGGGFITSSNISTTNYELSVDPIDGSAHFVSYLQHVAPLILPGGFSTGDITVEIVQGSSAGTYDAATRTFSTSEMYAIHFTGDLSAFGLTSPVLLPSTSLGDVAVDAGSGGQVTMDWQGSGQLSNPFDPNNPLQFSYRCAVNTVFEATPENVVGLDLTPDVVGLDLPQGHENRLVAKLDQSLAQIQRGNDVRAVRTLEAFIEQVDLMSGRAIDPTDADGLIAGAEDAIALINTGATADGGPRPTAKRK